MDKEFVYEKPVLSNFQEMTKEMLERADYSDGCKMQTSKPSEDTEVLTYKGLQITYIKDQIDDIRLVGPGFALQLTRLYVINKNVGEVAQMFTDLMTEVITLHVNSFKSDEEAELEINKALDEMGKKI